MHYRWRFALAVLFTGFMMAAFSTFGETRSDEGKVKDAFYTPEDRLTAFRAASVRESRLPHQVDILGGPRQHAGGMAIGFNDTVECKFDTPGKDLGGATNKFLCRITAVQRADGTRQELKAGQEAELVKVKYNDVEVFSEAAASRLLWAMGFYTDTIYPVRVVCHDCPAEPKEGSGVLATRTFREVIVERRHPGTKMEELDQDDQGWGWEEFEEHSEAPLHIKDGLKMLAAFLVYSDNKRPQQRLVCDGVKVDTSQQPYRTSCETSRLVVSDLGSTFGGGGRFTRGSSKMSLEHWQEKKVWKEGGTEIDAEPEQCTANLPGSWTGTLSHPEISEEGRRFAAQMLCSLSDEQIDDVFEVARVSEMPEYRDDEGNLVDNLTPEDIRWVWVETFKTRREELAAGRCVWQSPPVNAEDPFGIGTLPNYCKTPIH